MSSMIANIRKRIPDAEIVGFTLSPEDTRRRHGIDAFPITRVWRANYFVVDACRIKNVHPRATAVWRIKQGLKRIPWLRSLVWTIRIFGKEFGHAAEAARLIRRLDCLIITGGGALDEFWGGPWGHPWTLFKFALLSRILKVPFLFISVGKCSLEHRLSRFFARIALKCAAYRSYRDHQSKLAAQTLLPSEGDPVCPDLAYSYPCPSRPRVRAPRTREGTLVVGVSPIAWCDPRVWPVKDEQRYTRYVRRLAEAVKWLVEQKYRVVLFSTDGPDVRTIEDLQRIIGDWRTASCSIEVLPGPPKQTTDNLLLRLTDMDLVIASRLHGIILSHLLAVPVLAISYDPKVDVHMTEIGQFEHCVDIDDTGSVELIRRFRALEKVRKRESAHLARSVQLYREQADAQYDRLLGAVRPDCEWQEKRVIGCCQ